MTMSEKWALMAGRSTSGVIFICGVVVAAGVLILVLGGTRERLGHEPHEGHNEVGTIPQVGGEANAEIKGRLVGATPYRSLARPDELIQHRHAASEEVRIHKGKNSRASATDADNAEKLSSTEFLTALRAAVGKADPNEIRALLEKVPQDAALVDALKATVRDAAAGIAIQRYSAEALVRIGTAESVSFVLDQLLTAHNAGDTDRANLLLAALEAPTTTAGMRALFDVLVGRGSYAETRGTLPTEVASAIRKDLRAAPDRETVGQIAAELYLDPQVATNSQAMWELDEVSHPVMLAQLAGRAYEENLPETAAEFLDRLGQSDDQGAVQAMVQMVPNQSVPLDDVGMALYNWSLRHPQEALPGLFLEYLTDSARPTEQRSVAALGLAGTANRGDARVALEKAVQSERDPIVQTNLQRALTILDQEQPR
jgi:hypothetical protein